MPHLLEHIRYHLEDEPPDAGTSEFDSGWTCSSTAWSGCGAARRKALPAAD